MLGPIHVIYSIRVNCENLIYCGHLANPRIETFDSYGELFLFYVSENVHICQFSQRE